MIILSIDPGTQRRNPAGLVVIDFDPDHPKLLHASTVHGSSVEAAARNVAATARSLAYSFSVDAIAYEEAYLGDNPDTFKTLCKFGGVVLAVAEFCGVPAVGVYPVQAKAALCRDSQADKAAMVKMARLVLGLDRDLSEHESDAVGVGLFADGVLKEKSILQAAIAAERTN
jgi:Holliday junction resolvasome RuvABC endonuclease subunit